MGISSDYYNIVSSNSFVRAINIKGNGVARVYKKTKALYESERENFVVTTGLFGIIGIYAINAANFFTGLFSGGIFALGFWKANSHSFNMGQCKEILNKLSSEYDKIVKRFESMKKTYELRMKLNNCVESEKASIQKQIKELAKQREKETWTQNLEYSKEKIAQAKEELEKIDGSKKPKTKEMWIQILGRAQNNAKVAIEKLKKN